MPRVGVVATMRVTGGRRLGVGIEGGMEGGGEVDMLWISGKEFWGGSWVGFGSQNGYGALAASWVIDIGS